MKIFEAIALSTVISQIYDAAIDPSKWTAALQQACAFVGGFQAIIFWQDSASDAVATLHSYNNDPTYSRSYHEIYAPLNPLFPTAMFADVGAVHAASDLVPLSEMRETRFFNEWIKPQGLADSLGVLLERDASRAAFLTVQWRNDWPIGPGPRTRLELLVPHFQRAVAIGSLFSRESGKARALTTILEHIGAGVFLVSDEGVVVFANDGGRRMAEEGKLLWLANDTLRAADSAADLILAESIRAIERRDLTMHARGTSILLDDSPKEKWIATVLPLIEGERRHTGEAYHATAAVFVRSSLSANRPPLEALAKNYNLTAGETRVAEAVLRLSGNDVIAEALGLSRATVKTHLNRIFQKTATRNQSELIKLIAGL